MSASLQI